MSEHSANLLKNNKLLIQEAQQTSDRIQAKRYTNTYDSQKAVGQGQGDNLESSKRKMICHMYWNSIKLIPDFFRKKTLKARRQWDYIFKVKKGTPPPPAPVNQ